MFLLIIFLLLPYLFYGARRYFAPINPLVFLSFFLSGYEVFCLILNSFIQNYLFVGTHAKKEGNYNALVSRSEII